MKLPFSTIAVLSVGIAFFLVADGTSHLSQAQVRSSSNYQLQSDSINVGGGFSSSTNYIQESTVGEIATGRSTSSNFSLQAGYQQMQAVYLSLAGGADVIMSPDLPGITGGESYGSTTFTVTTDSPAGYQLTIQAENDPALQTVDTTAIADYVPTASPDPDPGLTPGPGLAAFGFAPTGVDIIQRFQSNGVTCNSGAQVEFGCYDGLSTVAKIIAQSVGSNHPTGATTTLNFEVDITSGANIESGVYTATTTVTALPL